MTHKTAKTIAQNYLQAGYSISKAFIALDDAHVPFLDAMQVIDAMESTLRKESI